MQDRDQPAARSRAALADCRARVNLALRFSTGGRAALRRLEHAGDSMPAPLPSAAGLGRFLAELKRRKVYRTTAAYAAGAFIVWQAADIAFPAFGLPATAMQPVVIFAIAGFPIAIVLAWLFEVTPQRQAAPVSTPDLAPPDMAPASAEPANAVTSSTRLAGIGRGMRVAVLSLVV
ncbi:MAG TPA: hypothetical protein VFY03_00385, partial [Woeseiaceae bacterium]|nr:hypothetical protein [Woeseiaceae bacterium]